MHQFSKHIFLSVSNGHSFISTGEQAKTCYRTVNEKNNLHPASCFTFI